MSGITFTLEEYATLLSKSTDSEVLKLLQSKLTTKKDTDIIIFNSLPDICNVLNRISDLFNTVYNNCLEGVYDKADTELDTIVDLVANELKNFKKYYDKLNRIKMSGQDIKNDKKDLDNLHQYFKTFSITNMKRMSWITQSKQKIKMVTTLHESCKKYIKYIEDVSYDSL